MQLNIQIPLYVAGVQKQDPGAGVTAGYSVWKGGKGHFTADSAAWAQGSIQLVCLSVSGQDLPIPGCSLNANGIVNFDIPPGEVKAIITGNPTALNAYAIGGVY